MPTPAIAQQNNDLAVTHTNGMSDQGWANYTERVKEIGAEFRRQAIIEGMAQGLSGDALDQYATTRANQMYSDWGRTTGIHAIPQNTIALKQGAMMAAAALGGAYVAPEISAAAGGGVTGGAVSGATLGAGTAAVTGGDITKGALVGGVTGGVAGGVTGTEAASSGWSPSDASALGDMTTGGGASQGMTAGDANALGNMTGGTAYPSTTGVSSATFGDETLPTGQPGGGTTITDPLTGGQDTTTGGGEDTTTGVDLGGGTGQDTTTGGTGTDTGGADTTTTGNAGTVDESTGFYQPSSGSGNAGGGSGIDDWGNDVARGWESGHADQYLDSRNLGIPQGSTDLTKVTDIDIGNALTKYGPLGLGAAGLAQQMGRSNDLGSKLPSGGTQRDVGNTLVSQFQSGTLNAADAHAIADWENGAIAQTRQYYANAHQSDSSAAVDAENRIHARAEAMREAARMGLLRMGLDALNMGDQTQTAAVLAEYGADQQLRANAINFMNAYGSYLRGMSAGSAGKSNGNAVATGNQTADVSFTAEDLANMAGGSNYITPG
jgi:hypothetical protein